MQKYAFILFICFLIPQAYANENIDEKIKKKGEAIYIEILKNKLVKESILLSNEEHANLSRVDIKNLDIEWRAEIKRGGGDLTQDILNREISQYLKYIKKEFSPIVSEVILMDNKGLNVGVSDATSDFWQGDEFKWKKTYQLGYQAVHISSVYLDDSTQQHQVQYSRTVEVEDRTPIGAITIGMIVSYMD